MTKRTYKRDWFCTAICGSGIYTSMKIEIKRDICIGAATCSAIAPDVFELDSDLKATVKNNRGADDATILEAAQSCPTLAIYIYDDAGKQIFPPPAA